MSIRFRLGKDEEFPSGGGMAKCAPWKGAGRGKEGRFLGHLLVRDSMHTLIAPENAHLYGNFCTDTPLLVRIPRVRGDAF